MASAPDTSPRACAARAEQHAVLPSGPDEGFAGYGVVGLPIASGHVLALRSWAASSIGPAYRSVWHRTPAGRWTFVADVAPELSCPRYAGAEVDAVLVGRVDVAWTAADALVVEVPAIALRWTLRVTATPLTRAFNALRPRLPARLGDFHIPQRGVLAIGAARFETFDAARHAPGLTRPA